LLPECLALEEETHYDALNTVRELQHIEGQQGEEVVEARGGGDQPEEDGSGSAVGVRGTVVQGMATASQRVLQRPHQQADIYQQITEMFCAESKVMAAATAALARQIVFHGGAATNADANTDSTNGINSAAAVSPPPDPSPLDQAARGFLDSLGLVGRSLHTATAAAHLCFSETRALSKVGVGGERSTELDNDSTHTSSSDRLRRVAALATHYALIEETLTDAVRYAESGVLGLQRLQAAVHPTTAGATAAGGADVTEGDADDDAGSGGADGLAPIQVPALEEEEEPEQDRLFEAYTGPLEPYSPFDDDTLTPEQQKVAWKQERAVRAQERLALKEEQARRRAGLDNSKAVLTELRAVLGGLGGGGGGGGGGSERGEGGGSDAT
jgi:hypothetical protein